MMEVSKHDVRFGSEVDRQRADLAVFRWNFPVVIERTKSRPRDPGRKRKIEKGDHFSSPLAIEGEKGWNRERPWY